jgi:hypothetical protein
MRTGTSPAFGILVALALSAAPASATETSAVEAAPNGIEFPVGYQDWPVISSSHRVDNNTLRVIVGNDLAVRAARAGQTNPWPDGAILGKLVWKEAPKDSWPKAIAPAEFVHAEFMFKDAAKYAGNGTGWGWARWVGMDQRPYGADASFSGECIGCHRPVKANDWVFTLPAQLP